MDRRDYEASYGRRLDVDDSRMVAMVEVEDDDGDTKTITLPITFDVCGLCNGTGKHVNPSIDSHGLSREDLDEDPDFAEAYFSGVYDVTCYRCAGKRVEASIDRDRANVADLRAYDAMTEADADYARLCESERRWGA